MVKENPIVRELKRIARSNNNLLKAGDVIQVARMERSPLHPYFEWDDSIAGQKYRLEQARELIRINISFIKGVETQARTFISLSTDRRASGGGYREMEYVLDNPTWRETMVKDALIDLENFERRYKALAELTNLLEEIKTTRLILTQTKGMKSKKRHDISLPTISSA